MRPIVCYYQSPLILCYWSNIYDVGETNNINNPNLYKR